MQRISWPGAGFEDLVERAAAMVRASGSRRRILGIAGAPASGKSTLAAELAARLRRDFGPQVATVGMDAFHLAHRILEQRGQVEIKGAPETFDGLGYLRLLERLKRSDETIYAPVFERTIEDSIANAIEITAEAKLIITEGNYLLLDSDPWRSVHSTLDEAWYVDLDDSVRQQRLLQRHLDHGHEPGEAKERTSGSDQRNAELIMNSMLPPDAWIEHRATPLD
ncbi:nucleoside/nucleotide kinase family protein [Microlunatus elymi]|uniref:Nucleoside/nucleotide kinase family protein n=1 Tax=Microlunatus elymi TaxID=2596828 RepID=A0A516PVE8_9ACTN|nr:nucleoside/nucleotide kinase family protein [Microlunatus elymi]QDP95165.1 nucleoside/nucleotide kinase family protein [Microlunatus elymi]